MAFVARDPHARLGEVVDNGHCMRHVQVVAGVPHSSTLRRGAKVKDTEGIPRGTVIGTFDANGRYANATDGSSHVAILLEQLPHGLRVVDQYQSRAGGVAERTIRYKGGQGKAADDGDAYHVVEVA
jgi:Cu/Ag efflux pump CusA